MHRFLTHEAIKEGIFNEDYCSASGAYSAWPAELLNNSDTLSLLMERLESDWLAMNPKHRKAFTFKEVDSLS